MSRVNELTEALRAALSGHMTVGLLDRALSHAVFPPGKLIRPLFAISLCEDLGGWGDDLLGASIALELVHVSSLIHDDLPSLDNDDVRRGRPTVHKAFGESTAVLAGDFLIPLAFKCISESSLPHEVRLKLSTSLSNAFMDVCHGQVRDMMPHGERGDLELIHMLKTGALFRCAANFGAYAANASMPVVEKVSQLGLAFGLCFQIANDFLDVSGSEISLGRETGSDEKNRKDTYFSDDKERGIKKLKDSIVLVRSLFSEAAEASGVMKLASSEELFSSFHEKLVSVQPLP